MNVPVSKDVIEEVWKDIPNYEGLYQVSNLGNVKSLDRVKIRKNGRQHTTESRNLSKITNRKGYYCVGLYNKNSNYSTITVHQLVAMAFLNHVQSGMNLVVDHIDNNKKNNRVDNLQILTNRQNCTKEKKAGTSSKYMGVSWAAWASKWRAQIRGKESSKHIGYFNCETAAHFAYQRESKQLNA